MSATPNLDLSQLLAARGDHRHDTAVATTVTAMGVVAIGLLFWLYGLGLESAAYAVMVVGLVPLCIIDLRHHRLPREITYPTIVACVGVLTVAALSDDAPRRVVTMLAGAVLYAGTLAVISAITHGSIGAGDVRLGVLLGAALGYQSVTRSWLGLAAGFAVCAVAAGGLLVFGRITRRDPLAFGPALAVGAVAVLLLVES